MNEQSTTLYFREGSSDKVYRAELVQRDQGYMVQFAFGRRGSTLQTGSKTPAPVSEEEALKVFQRLVKEKTAKGYTVGEDGTPYHGTENAGRNTGIRPQLLNPIDETEVEAYLDDSAFWMQEKFDGKRMLLHKVGDGTIEGINRRGLNVAIHEPVQLAAASLNGTFLFDGEIVGDSYIVFDCLERNGVDLRSYPYSERYATLPTFRSGCPIEVAATVKNARQKRLYYARLKGWGVEGVVFKRHDVSYTPDRSASGGPQLKCKFYATASVIVAAINDSKRSVAMDIYDGTRRVRIGNVAIPANAEIPKVGDVLEVRYLYAFRRGALFQPTFIHVRSDVLPSECGIGQLKFKKTSNDE